MASSDRIHARRRRGIMLLGLAPVMLGMLIFAALPSTAGAGPSKHSVQQRLLHLQSATKSVRIYLIAVEDNGRSGRRIGCGDSLVAVTRSIRPTTAPLTAAMAALLSDHRRFYGQSGLYNALYQSRLKVQSARVVNGKATIHLTGKMQLGGVCDSPRVKAQLEQTAHQFSTVRSTAIYINNVPLWKRLSSK
jgi:Sporulation and spore germination